jgi:hypothetical protein
MTEVTGFVTGAEAHDDETRASVETPQGRFYMDAPVIDLCAAAHSLAQVNRYNGHGRFPFSVATHSVLVSLLMEEVTGGDPFEGLWHDRAEYIMSDIPSPVKPLLPDWRALDRKVDDAFATQLGFPPGKTKECAQADVLALFIEAHQLMPSKGASWHDPDGLRPWALRLIKQGWKISEIDWRQSRDIFAQRHNEVKPVNIPRIEF